MSKRLTPIVAAALAATPLAAASPATIPPPTGGTISIEPTTADRDYDPALAVYARAASAAFTARGFTVLNEPGHAAYDLELILGRADVGTALEKVPGQSSPVLAGGLIVPFSTGKSDVVHVQRVRLELRIRRRGAPGVLWDGTAVTVREANRRRGAEQSAASGLIAALLQGYPAQPAGMIGVP